MHPDIKFCGLTRPEDAECAAALGAGYVGAIFAGGPRAITPEHAAHVLRAAGEDVQRVGVFASASIRDIVAAARTASLEIIQLHGDATVKEIEKVRRETGCQVWAVLRTSDGALPAGAADLIGAADAALLDAKVDGVLGGSGTTIPWAALAEQLAPLRGHRAIVLAGGLKPDNVRQAIATVRPDVVDVSSGVESAPGLKDHNRMRAFSEAVWA